MRLLRLCLLPLVVLLAAGIATCAVAQEPAPRPEAEQAEASDARAPSLQPQPSEESKASEKSEAAEQPAPIQAESPAPSRDQSSPAKTEAQAEGAARKNDGAKSAVAAKPSLPADSVTRHTLELPGRTLQLEATAGSIPLMNADGRVQARMAYVSYTLMGVDSRTRPVAFAFNGGPGSSSAWLHLGTLGPWRLPLEGDSARPSAPGIAMPNTDTWLDFSDLVMIDPVGTGYSRFENDVAEEETSETQPGARKGKQSVAKQTNSRQDLRKHYWSIAGDVDSIASFMSQWLTKTGRHTSPKLLVGESYGGFRVPKIAHALQNNYGVGMNLLVLVSPVLDYGFLRGHRHLPLNTVALLPSLSAAALETRGKTPSPALMREAEDYARGEYLTDLLRGPRDTAAVGRVIKRVTTLTALPAATVQKYGGRLDSYGYRREANESGGQVASAYDATVKGLNPEPSAPNARAEDPFVTALRAPLTGAMLDLYATKLAWRPEARYLLANGEVGSNWQYGNSPSPPEAVSDLKAALALDARLRTLVVHGYTDLVTPYFASTLVLDQLPAYGDARRLVQVTYPGGHMFYSRDASRAAFREDVLIMLAASLAGEAQTR
jgi:carboxypeptidase C (cathepsin A)